MASQQLDDFVSATLEKLNYLSEVLRQRCARLTNKEYAETREKCKDVLELCTKVRRNCSVFEIDLKLEASKLNISFDEIDTSNYKLDVCEINTSQTSHTTNVQTSSTISFLIDGVTKEAKFDHLNGKDIDTFWLNLKQFVNNYGSSGVQPVAESYSDDPILAQLQEIFGDSDCEPQVMSQNETQIIKGRKEDEKNIDDKNEHTIDNTNVCDEANKTDKDVEQITPQNIPESERDFTMDEDNSHGINMPVVGAQKSVPIEITESLKEDLLTGMKENFDNCQNSTNSNPKDVSWELRIVGESVEPSLSSEGVLGAQEKENALLNCDQVLASQCDENIQTSSETDVTSTLTDDNVIDSTSNLEKTSERMENVKAPGSQTNEEETPISDPDATQRFDPDATQSFDPDAMQRFDTDATQSLDPDATQRFDPDETQSLDPDATQRFDPDATQRFDPDATKRFDPDVLLKNAIGAPITPKLMKITEGLEKANNYERTQNIRKELMDILAEVACKERSDGEFSEVGAENTDTDSSSDELEQPEIYTDNEVNRALKYLEDSDTFSDAESVESCGSDMLLLSDTDEDVSSEKYPMKPHTSGGPECSRKTADEKDINIELNTTSEMKVEESKQGESKPDEDISPENNPIETHTFGSPECISRKRDESKQDGSKFVPKKCCVRLEKMDIEKVVEMKEQEGNSEEECMIPDKEKFVSKDCYVRLETFRLLIVSSDSESSSSSDREDREIDKLCDLSTLDRKRKESDSESGMKKRKTGTRVKRKRKKMNISGSDTEDLSGFSSVSESEIERQRGGIFDDELTVKEENRPTIDPNKLLTEIVCHTIHDSDSNSSSIDSDSDEGTVPKKCKNSSKDKSDKEQRSNDKDSWKNDPLLTGSLNLSTNEKKGNTGKHKKRKRANNSDSGSDSSRNSKKKIKNFKEVDPDWRSDKSSSNSSDSSDDFEDTIISTRSVRRKITDSDSDVEFVDAADGSPSKSNVINIDSDEDHEKKRGRRNILSVLSNENLTQETQQAARQEEERLMRIEKRNQQRISQSQADTADCIILDTTSNGYNVTVDKDLSKRLFPHQVDGVKFMWDACYESIDTLKNFEGTGCILAHNMGLGKTFQVVTLVHTLFRHSITNTKHVLIVCPLSTVSGWKKEFNTGIKLADSCKDINVINIDSSSDSDTRFGRINKWKSKGGVLIVGYEAFEKLTGGKKNNASKVEYLRNALVDPGPDLVVCDEGHLLKNGKALRTKALMEIRTKRRIALTGTPLQNNLSEYYHMVQFVKPNLLGTKHEFNRQFANPIMNGQYEDSDEADIKLMKKRTHVLHRLLKNTVQRYEATELKKYLHNMKDYALFIQLHPVQVELYKSFIEMTLERKTVKSVKHFFGDYQTTKYICSHPQLLYTMETQNAQRKKKVIKETDIISEEPEIQEIVGIPDGWWKPKCVEEVKTDIEFGTKLQVMMGIIEEAEKIHEKVLIFTSSLVELSSIEFFLKLKGTPSCPSWRPRRDYFRMDGTVAPSVRTRMCELFNDQDNKTLRLFLMSHKVGGLGLNLVAANRVILLGANFNPSHDTQSIYRAYRFGQNKPVFIYRLISMGTMEEKIYRRCVTKLAIASRVVDKHQIARHYKNLCLEDIYNTDSLNLSPEKPTPPKPEDDLLSNILLKFGCIHNYHQHQKLLENQPNEDLDEEDKLKAWEEFKMMNEKTTPVVNVVDPNGIFSRPIPPTVEEIMAIRWNQLNQPFPGPLNQPFPGQSNQPFSGQLSQPFLRPTAAEASRAIYSQPNQPRQPTTPMKDLSVNARENPRLTETINPASHSRQQNKQSKDPPGKQNPRLTERINPSSLSRQQNKQNKEPPAKKTPHLVETMTSQSGQSKQQITHNKDPPANQVTTDEMLRLAWTQLNKPSSSSNDPTIPIKRDQSQPQTTSGIPLAATHFLSGLMGKTASVKNQKKFRPNPFVVGTTKDSTAKDPVAKNSNPDSATNSNEILQNVSNNPAVSKKKGKNTSSIGPNPVLIGKFQNKKENLGTKEATPLWRQSSSDDFQKPSTNNLKPLQRIPQKKYTSSRKTPISGLPSTSTNGDTRIPQKKHFITSTPKKSTSVLPNSSKNGNIQKRSTPRGLNQKNTNPSETLTIDDDDDDDIILIDSPEKHHSSEKKFDGLSEVQRNIEKLNRNGFSIRSITQKKKPEKKAEEGKPDDSCVIEIL